MSVPLPIPVGLTLLLSAIACQNDARWRISNVMDRSMAVEAVLLDAMGGGLIGGCQGQGVHPTLEQCSAVIVKWNDKAMNQVYSAPGRVVALARSGSSVFADIAVFDRDRARNEHRLIASTDDGDNFEECGAIPGSPTQMVAVSTGEVWVLGPNLLLRTIDRGATWQPVNAPNKRNTVEERLAVDGANVLILGDGVLSSGDRGRTWLFASASGAKVTAGDRHFVAGVSNGKIVVGELSSGMIVWKAEIPTGKGVTPFKLIAEGDILRIAATPELSAMGGEVLLFESADAGRHWQRSRLREVFQSNRVDIGHNGRGLAVDRLGKIMSPVSG